MSWAWKTGVSITSDKASGNFVLTVMNIHNHHWWNPVLPHHEQEAVFIYFIWLRMWHWNEHSPKPHKFCDLSDVKKDGWRSRSSQLTCLLGQHMGVTLILALRDFRKKKPPIKISCLIINDPFHKIASNIFESQTDWVYLQGEFSLRRCMEDHKLLCSSNLLGLWGAKTSFF